MSRFSFLPSSLAWRRFFARSFDMHLETLFLIYFIGPIFGKYSLYIKLGQLLKQLSNYIFVLLPFYLILNSFICSYFGTSLGKYLFGINVNKVGKISLKDWLIRSFRLWRSGFAFGIPILSLWTLNREQKLVSKNEQTTYDKLSGICVTANKLSKFQIARAIILFIVLIACVFFITKR